MELGCPEGVEDGCEDGMVETEGALVDLLALLCFLLLLEGHVVVLSLFSDVVLLDLFFWDVVVVDLVLPEVVPLSFLLPLKYLPLPLLSSFVLPSPLVVFVLLFFFELPPFSPEAGVHFLLFDFLVDVV